MFDNWAETIIEVSKAEMIIEEMKCKMDELINDEAKGVMEAYRTAANEVENLKNDIARKRRRAIQLQQEIEELESKHEKADKFDMPRKYIDKFVREYTGDFAPGDTVYMVGTKRSWDKCDKCQGEKMITATIDGKTQLISCIKCGGRGQVEKTVKEVAKTKITDIQLTLCFHEDRVGIWSRDVIHVQGRDYSIHPESIFRTHKETEEYITSVVGGDNNV